MRCCQRKGSSNVLFRALMSHPNINLRGFRALSPDPRFFQKWVQWRLVSRWGT